MSERTTIGGTVYEAIGSSSSNLLLKCNGTARIQWGGKLIDLIKNGKIASEGSQELIFIIKDESEIKSDGIYVLTTEESDQLWVCKDGVKYDFTGTDLYISASKPQNLTGDQKRQALDNIGMYYNTLNDVKLAGIQNGIVYIVEEKTLYTIKDGLIEEFEAKVKTISVDQEMEGVKVIDSSVKIVLSILDDEYLVLADERITANYSIHVNDSAQLGSESADKNQGYRLYIEGGTSWLDVDEINVRNGIKIKQYEEVTYDEFKLLIESENLKPLTWYLITDFQNHWKLPIANTNFNRPILVRALTNKSIYKESRLFNNHNIKIEYDYTYSEPIRQTVETVNGPEEKLINARGRIIWMKDEFNNEANFDFLDYTDANGKDLATLHFHPIHKDLDRSIFPKNSRNNKLVVYDLKGTVLKNQIIDDSNVSVIDFKYKDEDDDSPSMYLCDNDIECRGLIIHESCSQFSKNILKEVFKLEVYSNFNENQFYTVYYHSEFKNIDFLDEPFIKTPDINVFNPVVFTKSCSNSTLINVRHCTFQDSILNSKFTNIENGIFAEKLNKATINKIERLREDYWYNFKEIINSTINEILQEVSIEVPIKNSNIGTVKQITYITNCSIEDCDIIEISNSVITKSLTNNVIGVINNSEINNTITNSKIDLMDSSKIFNAILDSTLNTIKETEIKGDITKSTFVELSQSDIMGTIENSNFGLVSDESKLHGSIIKSNFKTILNSEFNTTSIINNSVFDTISDSLITQEINSSKILYLTSGSQVQALIINSNFDSFINSKNFGQISNSSIDILNTSTIHGSIDACTFKGIFNSNTINSDFSNSEFININNCVFDEGSISDVISYCSLIDLTFNRQDYTLLFNTDKRKEIYLHSGELKIISIPDVIFYRGMIIMHSGIEAIPKGWAICDGGEYEFEGVKSKTPNLINRFIKAVGSVDDIKEVKNPSLNENNQLMLNIEHLPKHQHNIQTAQLPQYTTDEITGYTSRYDPQSKFVTTSSGEKTVSVTVCVTVPLGDGESATGCGTGSDSIYLSGDTINYLGTREAYETIAHYHKINWNADFFVTDLNNPDIEQQPINIEPHYFALIFIMKL